MNNEKAAIIIPYLHERNDSIDQHIQDAVASAYPSVQQLVSSKSHGHLPDAGLNPVVDAASYLFYLMGKLKRIKEYRDLAGLHDELALEVRKFQQRVHGCRYNVLFIEEYIPIATYALCITFDDLIAETPWGAQGKWQKYSLVTALFAETASQKSLFIILERLLMDPNVYIDVVEFIYICLSFGLKCRDEDACTELSYEQNAQITNYLYKFIQAYRGNVSKVLAPFPLQPRQTPVDAHAGFGRLVQTISDHSAAWLGKLKIFQRRPKFSAEQMLDPVLVKSLQSLQNRVNNAMNYIRKGRITRNGVSFGMSSLPWYLLIGSSGAGKTSLLANADINFIIGKKANQKRKQKAAAFDWWITPNAVLVDVPGVFLTQTDVHDSLSNEHWRHFLMLVGQHQKRKPFGGVILAISVPELTERKYRDDLVESLRCRIREIQQAFGAEVQFYIAVTKMDLLPGFIDFFNDCSTEELSQVFGVIMPASLGEDSAANVFNNRFHALIKTLNHQVIQRLHFERNSHAKSNIKDFPLYVDGLKDEIASILNALHTESGSFCLRGVYLTSAEQGKSGDGDGKHPEMLSAAEISENVLEILNIPAARQCPYFIKQFILQGILQ